jgi:hypothetical protein
MTKWEERVSQIVCDDLCLDDGICPERCPQKKLDSKCVYNKCVIDFLKKEIELVMSELEKRIGIRIKGE